MRSPEMRKKRRLRSVWAPHSRSAGTSMGPKLSFSVRLFSVGPAIPADMLRQVEDQHFSLVAFGKRQCAFVRLQCVARAKALPVHGERASRHVHIGPAAIDVVPGALGAI